MILRYYNLSYNDRQNLLIIKNNRSILNDLQKKYEQFCEINQRFFVENKWNIYGSDQDFKNKNVYILFQEFYFFNVLIA